MVLIWKHWFVCSFICHPSIHLIVKEHLVCVPCQSWQLGSTEKETVEIEPGEENSKGEPQRNQG